MCSEPGFGANVSGFFACIVLTFCIYVIVGFY